jgi:hypothetical protein
MCGPDVNREAEEFRADWAGQIRVAIAPPPIAEINRDGIVAGQRLDSVWGYSRLEMPKLVSPPGSAGLQE